MDFFTNDPPNNELEESFLTAPTDSYKPDYAKGDGAAKVPSLAYTQSQSAGEPAAERQNPEETVTVEQDGDQEEIENEEDAKRRRKAYLANLEDSVDQNHNPSKPTYGRPEIHIPVPMGNLDDLNMQIPTAAHVKKSIDAKLNTYMANAGGPASDGLILPSRNPSPKAQPCLPIRRDAEVRSGNTP